MKEYFKESRFDSVKFRDFKCEDHLFVSTMKIIHWKFFTEDFSSMKFWSNFDD